VSKPPRKLTGRPAFDDRGNATWKFAGENEADIETGRVRALAEGLSLEAPSQEVSPDPYNQELAQGKEKAKRRSLDDMRRLDEQMKREHEELVRKLRSRTLKPRASDSDPARGRRLRVRFDARELLVDAHRPSILIGRSEDNDVVVKGQLVSRLHACIEISDDELILTDISANGTFVQTTDGEHLVRRGRFQLNGRGMIGFGHQPKQGSPHTLHFTCEEL
jgi:hypothetical protein